MTKPRGKGQPFEPGHKVNEKHGLYTVANNNPSELPSEQIDTVRELRAMVRSNDGRRDLRLELAARLGVIAQIIFNEMAAYKRENPEGSVLDPPVTKRGLSWISEYRRALEAIPQHDSNEDITDFLKGVVINDSTTD